MRNVNVMVVDDNDAFLGGALLALSGLRGVQVTAIAKSGAAALSIVQSKSPDLILMDINMPVMDGIEAAWRLREGGFNGRIVLMSLMSEQEARAQSRKVETDAFIDKQHFVDGIAEVITNLFPRTPACACCE